MSIGYDLHTHSDFSDGKETVEQMAEAAIKKGFWALGISDHAPVPWDNVWCVKPEALKKQREAVAAAKQQFAGRLNLLWGFELDACTVMDAGDCDYLIGSTHELMLSGNHRSVDESEQVMLATVRDYFAGDYYAYTRKYYEALAHWAQRDVDILGHVDVVTKFNEGGKYFDENDPRYLRAAEAAIETLAKAGLIFELNAGAIPRGYRKTPYPSMQVLRLIRAHGGRILLSSDAHCGANIGFGFADMLERAKACGFTYVMAPSAKGRPFEERRI